MRFHFHPFLWQTAEAAVLCNLKFIRMSMNKKFCLTFTLVSLLTSDLYGFKRHLRLSAYL